MKRSSIIFCLMAIIGLAAAAKPPKLPPKPTVDTAQRSVAGDRWKAFQFLLGSWSGEGVGPAGQGPGGMVVETDLNDSILRLTNQVDFAAKDKKTAYRGTMVVSSSQKALFLDNEGHVLHYTFKA